MSSRAIDPLGSVRVDDVRDPYRSERVRAQMQADRVAPPQPFAHILAARPAAAASTAPLRQSADARRNDPGESIDKLRGQYTAHCLRNAVLAFHDQQARLEARSIAVNQAERDEQTLLQGRAVAANDLGTIQGLLPLQAYRYVVVGPLMLSQQSFTVANATQGIVGPVSYAAASHGATDNALSTGVATGEGDYHFGESEARDGALG